MSAKLCYFGYFSKLQAKKWGQIICSCDGLLVTKLLTTLKHRNVWLLGKQNIKKEIFLKTFVQSNVFSL